PRRSPAQSARPSCTGSLVRRARAAYPQAVDIQKVLSEWFGSISDWDDYEPDKAQRWWSAAPAFDAYLERHYRELVERALSGQLERWRETPSGTLGGVLLLDQFTRNIFRGTKEMYLGDARARQWTREALNQ